jgi:omega-6 fatty acid desaturase (delta-12 desaturase)
VSDIDGHALRALLRPYQQPVTRRSLWELGATIVPLAALWGALYVCMANGWWWGLLLSLPAGAFLVRLFMIQHDCGHHAFFRSAAANTWAGRVIGVLTMTPYDYWRRTHAIHHATSGNLDRRSLGAIELLTVGEYRALPPVRRLAYRLYRHPLVLLGLGPSYMFLLQHRLPIGVMRERWAWMSVLGNNLGLALMAAALVAAVGPRTVLLAHLPVVVVAATIGVWLFYVQHQFEDAYWMREGRWEPNAAATGGSSHLRLPAPLAWLTAHIGAHHVHHASSRIPFYRLPEVLRREPSFPRGPELGLKDSVKALSLGLWDEDAGRMVSFRAAPP